MVELHLTIKGLSPLLMHNPEGTMGIDEKKSVSTGPRKFPLPKEEAEKGLYRLDNGILFIPAIALRASILMGAKNMKINKKAAGTLLRGALILKDEIFVLGNGKGKPIKKWVVDTRRVVHKGTSGTNVAVMRSRAKVELPWGLEASFYLEEVLVNPEDVKTIANRAGMIAGLLDYRPNKSGTFGRYKVIHYKTIPI